MWICRSRDLSGRRACNNIARIERAEVIFRQDCASVFRKLEVEIDKLMDGAALQKPEDFGHGKRGCDGPDERSADCLSSQQRYPAAVELAVAEHTFVCRAIIDLFAFVLRPPDLRGGPGRRQRVQPQRAIVTVPASQSGLDNEVKSDLVERLPSEAVMS
jgi:hypothetical protein